MPIDMSGPARHRVAGRAVMGRQAHVPISTVTVQGLRKQLEDGFILAQREKGRAYVFSTSFDSPMPGEVGMMGRGVTEGWGLLADHECAHGALPSDGRVICGCWS